MFEQALEEKFKAIFKAKDVSYDSPGPAQEQEVLFIQIEEPVFAFKDGYVKAMVTGKAIMFGANDQLTFGFFAKSIKEADRSLTKDLVFRELESNTQRFKDKVQRGFSFTYFFNSQYDPALGTITSVNTSVEES